MDASFFDSRYLSTDSAIVKQAVHTWPTDEEMRNSDEKPFIGDPPPESIDRLDFEPQSMVGWYQPSELVKAGLQSFLSSIFGAYADKREVESVLTGPLWHDYSQHVRKHGDLWIDYVADLGDGWNPTYTIARLLAEKELAFTHNGESHRTQRGQILVMGGDQVYPTASSKEYDNRMIEPYRCALPSVAYVEQAPHLYLIPGNHDWYDGLNSFFKLFCQNRWVGAWKTQQRRSYFALKLTDTLWLWGIDIQLSDNIDKPQLDYFEHLATEVMQEGSEIILCTAVPSWVFVEAYTKEEKNEKKKEKKKEEIYHSLGHLEKRVIKKHGHEVIVGLAGDWHNYTRYASKNRDQHQRFVCGGGGAYLYPTHNMPIDLKLPEKFDGAEYRRKTIFPSEKDSKKLANWSLFFPLFRINWGLTTFLGLFYLLFAWIVQSVSKIEYGAGNTLLDQFKDSIDLTAFINILTHSPVSVVFLIVLVAGMMGSSGYESWAKKIPHGGLHGLAHVAVLFGAHFPLCVDQPGRLEPGGR